MAAKLLDGKLMAAELEEELKKRVDALIQAGKTPGLTVILVGDDPASQTYVSNKEKACARAGHTLPHAAHAAGYYAGSVGGRYPAGKFG